MVRLWFTKNNRTLIFCYDPILLTVTPIAAFAIVSCKIPAKVFRMYQGEGDFLQVSQSNICNFVDQHWK